MTKERFIGRYMKLFIWNLNIKHSALICCNATANAPDYTFWHKEVDVLLKLTEYIYIIHA